MKTYKELIKTHFIPPLVAEPAEVLERGLGGEDNGSSRASDTKWDEDNFRLDLAQQTNQAGKTDGNLLHIQTINGTQSIKLTIE